MTGAAEQIVKALQELYSDTSVGPEVTRDDLEEIKDEIDVLLDALE